MFLAHSSCQHVLQGEKFPSEPCVPVGMPGVVLDPWVGEVEEPESHLELPWQWKNLSVALGDQRVGVRLQKPCGCRRMPAIPVISRGLAGGKQQEMPSASSHQSQGCCVPQDTHSPKPEGLLPTFSSWGEGSKGHQKSQQQHWLALVFFLSLSLASLDVKIQAKIK